MTKETESTNAVTNTLYVTDLLARLSYLGDLTRRAISAGEPDAYGSADYIEWKALADIEPQLIQIAGYADKRLINEEHGPCFFRDRMLDLDVVGPGAIVDLDDFVNWDRFARRAFNNYSSLELLGETWYYREY